MLRSVAPGFNVTVTSAMLNEVSAGGVPVVLQAVAKSEIPKMAIKERRFIRAPGE